MFTIKKIVAFALLLSVMALSLFACSAPASPFSGEWRFSKISSFEFSSEIDEETKALYAEYYGVEGDEAVLAAARAALEEEGVFAPCYVRFEGDRTYTYDSAMEREATWVFFKTSENAGFLSFYTEIDPSEVTPDPLVFPPVVYDAQTNTLSLTMAHTAFVVTIELVK